MTSERKKRARCALCDTTESPGGWFHWNNRPTVKFCGSCWGIGAMTRPRRRWFYLWLK